MEEAFKILSVQDEVATIQLDIPLENLKKIQSYSKVVNLKVESIINAEIGDFIYKISRNGEDVAKTEKLEKGEKSKPDTFSFKNKKDWVFGIKKSG